MNVFINTDPNMIFDLRPIGNLNQGPENGDKFYQTWYKNLWLPTKRNTSNYLKNYDNNNNNNDNDNNNYHHDRQLPLPPGSSHRHPPPNYNHHHKHHYNLSKLHLTI